MQPPRVEYDVNKCKETRSGARADERRSPRHSLERLPGECHQSYETVVSTVTPWTEFPSETKGYVLQARYTPALISWDLNVPSLRFSSRLLCPALSFSHTRLSSVKSTASSFLVTSSCPSSVISQTRFNAMVSVFNTSDCLGSFIIDGYLSFFYRIHFFAHLLLSQILYTK